MDAGHLVGPFAFLKGVDKVCGLGEVGGAELLVFQVFGNCAVALVDLDAVFRAYDLILKLVNGVIQLLPGVVGLLFEQEAAVGLLGYPEAAAELVVSSQLVEL